MAAAHEATLVRWSAHPWRARGLRLLAYGLPIAFSLGFVHVVTATTGTPTRSLWAFLAWWAGVSLVATAVVALVYRVTRRLIPLGALLELSLAFPDSAPSRFQLALRTGTIASLEERVRLTREAREAPTTQQAAEILLRLVAALNAHDRITAGHADRVRAYSYALGQRLGLATEDLDRLNWAALLHDIGKLEVGEEILNKTGRPTDEEWESLRLHPLHGEALVGPLREWLGEWIDAVGHHHERWDGDGYPRGLAGDAIPRAGRIVAIADTYDVITSSRSYKEPASPAEARAELVRHSGRQFDPRYVRAFVDLSLSRMRLVMGPLAWLSHAPLLARLPLTPSVGSALGGVAAVAATTATVLPGPAHSLQAADVHERRAPLASAQHVVVTGKEVPAAVVREKRAAGTAPEPKPQDLPAPSPTWTAEPDSELPAAPEAPPADDPTPPTTEPTPKAPAPPSPEPTPDPPRESPSPTPPPIPTPNQPPSFAPGGDQSVTEDTGPQAVAWATAISPGPATEAAQRVSFTVTTSAPALFSVPPAIAPDGTLTYTPAADASGSAKVVVTAHDDGGTADGGNDSSAASTFEIVVQPVNDAPGCSLGSDQKALSVLGTQSVPGFATSSPGPVDESGQNVSFVVTTDMPGLFLVPPAISADGTLTYTPKLLALGVATVTVRAVDDGGTANGGTDTSPPQTFTITVV